MMNLVCIGLGLGCAVLTGALVFMCVAFNKAMDKVNELDNELDKRFDRYIKVLTERNELKRQLEETQRSYAELLEEQYDNVVSIYRNR